jgi:hypothetical protein
MSCVHNIDCDDGLACTVDRCTQGTCEHLLNDTQCLSSNPCIFAHCQPEGPNADAAGCVHTPVSCMNNRVCDPSTGACVECTQASDCIAPNCCATMQCSQNRCQVAAACGKDGLGPICCQNTVTHACACRATPSCL